MRDIKAKSCLALSLAILVAAIVLHVIPAANAQQHTSLPGPYMLVAHSNNNASVGVFRLDTVSGAVSYCYVTGTNSATVTCTSPNK